MVVLLVRVRCQRTLKARRGSPTRDTRACMYAASDSERNFIALSIGMSIRYLPFSMRRCRVKRWLEHLKGKHQRGIKCWQEEGSVTVYPKKNQKRENLQKVSVGSRRKMGEFKNSLSGKNSHGWHIKQKEKKDNVPGCGTVASEGTSEWKKGK